MIEEFIVGAAEKVPIGVALANIKEDGKGAEMNEAESTGTRKNMTRDEIKTKALEILNEIAPEADLSAFKPDVNFREQFDLDPMDSLKSAIALDEEFQANIPETEYTNFSH